MVYDYINMKKKYIDITSVNFVILSYIRQYMRKKHNNIGSYYYVIVNDNYNFVFQQKNNLLYCHIFDIHTTVENMTISIQNKKYVSEVLQISYFFNIYSYENIYIINKLFLLYNLDLNIDYNKNKNLYTNNMQILNSGIRHKKNTCMIKDCNNLAISSHVISSSFLKKWCSMNDNLPQNESFFYIDSSIVNKDFFKFFQNTKQQTDIELFFNNNKNNLSQHMKTPSSMGIFNGYCKIHDHSIFKKIDHYDNQLDIETVYLNMRRIIDYEYWRCERDLYASYSSYIYSNYNYKIPFKNINDFKNEDFILFKNNIDSYIIKNNINLGKMPFFVSLSNKIKDTRYRKKYMDNINNLNYNEKLKYRIISFNFIFPFIFYGSHFMEKDAENNKIIYKENINIIQECDFVDCTFFMKINKNNTTDIVFCFLNDDNINDEIINRYYNSFKELDIKDWFMFFLKQISLGVISNDFIKSIKNNKQDSKIFMDLINNHNFTGITVPNIKYLNIISENHIQNKNTLFSFLNKYR